MLNQAAYNQAQRRKRKQAKRQNLHTQRRDAQRQTHLYELANQALHHQHTLLSGQLLACPAVLTAAAGLTNLLDHLHRTHRRSAEPGHARRVVHPKKSRTGTFGDDAVWVALIAEYDLPIAQRQALIQIVADGYVTASTLLRHVATARPSDLASSLEDLMRLATEHRPHTTTTTTTTTATAALRQRRQDGPHAAHASNAPSGCSCRRHAPASAVPAAGKPSGQPASPRRPPRPRIALTGRAS